MTRQEFLSPEQIRKRSIYTGVFEREVEWTLTVQTGITLPSGAKDKHRKVEGRALATPFDIHLASSRPMYYGHRLHVSSGGYQETLANRREGDFYLLRDFVESFKFIRPVCPFKKGGEHL